jgi:hypothetical protein
VRSCWCWGNDFCDRGFSAGTRDSREVVLVLSEAVLVIVIEDLDRRSRDNCEYDYDYDYEHEHEHEHEQEEPGILSSDGIPHD